MKIPVQMRNSTSRVPSAQGAAGFTLIELILYVALLSLFMVGAVRLVWDVVYAGAKSHVQRNVNQPMRFASKRIVYELRNASAINSVSAQSLCLASSVTQRNPTRIFFDNGQLKIAWGGGSSNCTGMQFVESLTPSSVTASSVLFAQRTSGADSVHVDYAFTLSATGTRAEWQKSQDIQGSVEMRAQ